MTDQYLLEVFRQGFDDELCNNDKKTFNTDIENIAYELGVIYAFYDWGIQNEKEIIKEIKERV